MIMCQAIDVSLPLNGWLRFSRFLKQYKGFVICTEIIINEELIYFYRFPYDHKRNYISFVLNFEHSIG